MKAMQLEPSGPIHYPTVICVAIIGLCKWIGAIIGSVPIAPGFWHGLLTFIEIAAAVIGFFLQITKLWDWIGRKFFKQKTPPSEE